jgi:hypothetical protein
MRQRVLSAMAAYYITTGLWPLLHLRSFEMLTGPKTDRWLVHMVGGLALTNGIVIGTGARRERDSLQTTALAVLSATAFAAIDVIYVARGRIRPIYLADAVVEMAFVAGLILREG